MGFWNNVLEGLKLIRIWEDDLIFFNTQTLWEIDKILQENTKNVTESNENGEDE